MTKAKQQEIIDAQERTIKNLKEQLIEHKKKDQDGEWFPWVERDHYIELQETAVKNMEYTDKLRESNAELISTIANLNGGVLKDLSQTIVNLTGRNQ